MDHYLFNDGLSTKLGILFYSSVNSKIKINNNPFLFYYNMIVKLKALIDGNISQKLYILI